MQGSAVGGLVCCIREGSTQVARLRTCAFRAVLRALSVKEPANPRAAPIHAAGPQQGALAHQLQHAWRVLQGQGRWRRTHLACWLGLPMYALMSARSTKARSMASVMLLRGKWDATQGRPSSAGGWAMP